MLGVTSLCIHIDTWCMHMCACLVYTVYHFRRIQTQSIFWKCVFCCWYFLLPWPLCRYSVYTLLFSCGEKTNKMMIEINTILWAYRRNKPECLFNDLCFSPFVNFFEIRCFFSSLMIFFVINSIFIWNIQNFNSLSSVRHRTEDVVDVLIYVNVPFFIT